MFLNSKFIATAGMLSLLSTGAIAAPSRISKSEIQSQSSSKESVSDLEETQSARPFKAFLGLAMSNGPGAESTLLGGVEKGGRIGYDLGLGVEGRFSHDAVLGGEIDLAYVSRGFSYSGETDFASVRANINFNYLLLPILVRAYLPNYVSFGVGPYAGLRVGSAGVSSSSSNKSQNNSSDSSSDFDLRNANSFDFGLVASVGVRVPTKALDIVGDLRFQRGLANIFDLPSGSTAKNAQNQAVTLSAGVAF